MPLYNPTLSSGNGALLLNLLLEQSTIVENEESRGDCNWEAQLTFLCRHQRERILALHSPIEERSVGQLKDPDQFRREVADGVIAVDLIQFDQGSHRLPGTKATGPIRSFKAR